MVALVGIVGGFVGGFVVCLYFFMIAENGVY
jgi:hypothetical protein